MQDRSFVMNRQYIGTFLAHLNLGYFPFLVASPANSVAFRFVCVHSLNVNMLLILPLSVIYPLDRYQLWL